MILPYQKQREGISEKLTLQSTGRGGGEGGAELSQHFKSWTLVTKSPKMDFKIIFLAETKFMWLNQFFLFTIGDSINLKLGL